jgi:hypothetical protein
MARLKEAWSFVITPLKNKPLRVLDLGDGKKKPLGFGTLVMGKKIP